jgi:hypothetical protein
MESRIRLSRIHALKFASAAGLTLLTAETLFAQSAGQSDLDELKARMDQKQKHYEQRIEKMDQEHKQDKEQISKKRYIAIGFSQQPRSDVTI